MAIVLALGAGIWLALLAVRGLAAAFGPGTTTVEHPWPWLVALLVGAGLLWTALIPALRRLPRGRLPVWAVLLAGLTLRALFFGSQPVYENDFNRYLWDGAVVAQGLDPYALSPEAALTSEDPAIATLREQSGGVLADINNGPLTTIYPPVAQAAFAAAYILRPFDRDALRLVFLLSDLLALFLLVRALPRFGQPSHWALLYALCPLGVFAGFNTLHMDVLLAPFLLGALMLVRTRPWLAGLMLVLAAGVKLWPLLLAPVLYRNWLDRPAKLAGFATMIAALSALMLLPMFLALGDSSGLQAYSTGWNRSAFLFPHIEAALGALVSDPSTAARLLVAASLGAAAVLSGWLTRGEPARTLPAALLWVSAALLFLSPTGYPWYALWLLPLLPFAPRAGLGLLFALLPLHYARFALGERGDYRTYLDVLVPVQFGLPLLWLTGAALLDLRKDRIHAPALPTG